jgi:hypothetical protein
MQYDVFTATSGRGAAERGLQIPPQAGSTCNPPRCCPIGQRSTEVPVETVRRLQYDIRAQLIFCRRFPPISTGPNRLSFDPTFGSATLVRA